MNEYKGLMPTKVELTLEQSQQGVSNDVLNISVILFSIYNDDGNPSRANIKQALWLVLTEPEDSYKDGDGDTSFQLSRIHYHMLMLKLQRHTIGIKIQESRKLKLKDKEFRKL
ncbi:hypothetical protein Tco_1234803 [Tanacetum coccineum]